MFHKNLGCIQYEIYIIHTQSLIIKFFVFQIFRIIKSCLKIYLLLNVGNTIWTSLNKISYEKLLYFEFPVCHANPHAQMFDE